MVYRRLAALTSMFEIDLSWPVASKYVLRRSSRGRELALYPAVDATVTWRRPFDSNSSLYAEFAKLDGSGSSCQQFAERYGLLFASNYADGDADQFQIETLSFWRGHIRYIGRVIDFCELGKANPAEAFRQYRNEEFSLHGQLELALSIKSSKAPPSLDVRCTCLLAAMELQAIRSILAGRRSLQCIECSGWFEIGADARRSIAKFCSIRCKDSYHNRLKASKRLKQSKEK
jgi:hypothetical protein